jgi:hypothetical protein
VVPTSLETGDAAGIGEGARTGIASLVTGVLFMLTMFVTPLVSVMPYEVATPALVIVGFLMMAHLMRIPFDDDTVADPGVPHHGDHAVHLLDLQRDRRGPGQLHAAAGRDRPRATGPAAPLGGLGGLRGLLRHRADAEVLTWLLG